MSRTPFTRHRGTALPLMRDHVDTDQIIPKQFLARIERTGFGGHLFHDWRTGPDGRPDASFPLNDPRFAGASILVAGSNFGCGSSREHAVWALSDFGFRVVVAVSFADIFFGNAVENGLLPAAVSESAAAALARHADAGGGPLDVDLDREVIEAATGLSIPFVVPALARERLLGGLDAIDEILAHEAGIRAYETARGR